MLIDSPRITARDRQVWQERERLDALYCQAQAKRLDRMEHEAVEAIQSFAARGTGYVGVSWGKDSVVVADLCRRAAVGWPLVWVRVFGVENPDCPLVRDAYLSRYPVDYDEIEAEPGRRRTSAVGFAIAASRHGDRYISGVRAQESRDRQVRVAVHGLDSGRTLAPLGRWRSEHVFAYLYRYCLPVHPAYACSFGGTLDRGRIRVGAIGGSRGTGKNRREWEEYYYRDRLRKMMQETE